MSHLEGRLGYEINRLDSILSSLQSIQEAFEQAKEKYNVDDYFDIMVALNRGKEIREKLFMIVQRQSRNLE